VEDSSETVAVSNTTPLSELAKIGQLALLREMYGTVTIPREVFEELRAADQPVVAAAPLADWIQVRPVADLDRVAGLRASTGLGWGECAAIILAEELPADLLLMDDPAACREAQARGLRLTGTIGTILAAKRLGLVTSVRERLDDLIAHGTRIGHRLYHDALALAGEL
jgi:predicted nucleic acid-binding protein